MSEPMSDERLAEIRERAQAATKGPWKPYPSMGEHFVGYVGGDYLRGVGDLSFGEGEQAEADKAFTLAAREDVPALLAEVERLRAEQVIDRQALDRAAADHAQLRVELVDTVGEARSDIAGLESLARRLRTAWESARNGRRSARRLNAELVRSMDMLRAELAETTHVLQVTGEKLEAIRGQRDRAEAERDAAREQVKRVRDMHTKFVCNCGADHGIGCAGCGDDEYPCPSLLALDGTEAGRD